MKLFKNNQDERRPLPKIKHFLTKMVQMRGYFLTKCINDIHEDKNIKQIIRYSQETGRSMVEMLGVLAIIGVLSVGGIAGYSKAMYKQKMNKTVDIVSNILMGLNELLLKNSDEDEEISKQNAVKLGIVDKALCDASYKCTLPNGGEIQLSYGAFGITFRESNRINLCVDFLSHHWETALPINYNAISAVTYKGDHNFIYSTITDNFYNLEIKTSYTLADIKEACNNACDNDYFCYVYFYKWKKHSD